MLNHHCIILTNLLFLSLSTNRSSLKQRSRGACLNSNVFTVHSWTKAIYTPTSFTIILSTTNRFFIYQLFSIQIKSNIIIMIIIVILCISSHIISPNDENRFWQPAHACLVLSDDFAKLTDDRYLKILWRHNMLAWALARQNLMIWYWVI